MGLKPNRALYRGGKPYDVIVGTFLVVGVDEEDFTDLREEDAAYLRSCSIRRRSLSTSQGGWSSPRWFLAGLDGPAFFKKHAKTSKTTKCLI